MKRTLFLIAILVFLARGQSMDQKTHIKSAKEAEKYLEVKGQGNCFSCYAPEEFPGLFFCFGNTFIDTPQRSSFLVTEDGEIFNATLIIFSGLVIDDALKKIRELNIFPKTKKQALKMAIDLVKLSFPAEDVIDDSTKQNHYEKLPLKISRKDFPLPEVIQKSDYYEIVIHAVDCPSSLMPGGMDEVSVKNQNDSVSKADCYVRRHVVKLGNGICEVR